MQTPAPPAKHPLCSNPKPCVHQSPIERSTHLSIRKTYPMRTKKICLILTALLNLSGTLPAAAMDHETENDLSMDFLPSVPTNLVVEPGDGSATLRWDYPDSPPVDAWQYRQNAEGWQDMSHTANTHAYTVMHLSNGATYSFEVRAHNAAGWGPASAPAIVTLNAAPTITGLESVSFTENGTGPVATYSARDGEGHAIAWSLSGTDAGAFSFTTNRERHTMTLSFRSVPDYERPLDGPPADNAYQVMVVATDHGLPALSTHYPVTVTVANVDEDGPVPLVAGPEQSSGPAQTEYVGWVVRAVLNNYKDVMGWLVRAVANHGRKVLGMGPRAEHVEPKPEPVYAGKPNAPAVLMYAGVASAVETSGRMHVTVFKPASNGSPLTGYEYQVHQNGDLLLDWTSAGLDAATLEGLAPGSSSSFRIGGLTHGKSYTVAVRAVNGMGAGDATLLMATPGRILAPSRLQAVAGDGLVMLTWAAAVTEGPMITQYESRWHSALGDWSSWKPIGGDALVRGQMVVGLINGVDYTFEVRAANPAGVGLVAQVTARPGVAEPDDTVSRSQTELRGSDPL